MRRLSLVSHLRLDTHTAPHLAGRPASIHGLQPQLPRGDEAVNVTVGRRVEVAADDGRRAARAAARTMNRVQQVPGLRQLHVAALGVEQHVHIAHYEGEGEDGGGGGGGGGLAPRPGGVGPRLSGGRLSAPLPGRLPPPALPLGPGALLLQHLLPQRRRWPAGGGRGAAGDGAALPLPALLLGWQQLKGGHLRHVVSQPRLRKPDVVHEDCTCKCGGGGSVVGGG